MKIFFDFEMTGLHQKTTPISLGLVSEDGKTFYAEFSDYETKQLNDWLNENVIQNLRFNNDYSSMPKTDFDHRAMKGDKKQVSCYLQEWLSQFENTVGVEMWGDVLAYDWVLFCELFDAVDTAERLPKVIYYIPFDISTLMRAKGIDPDVNREEFCGIFGKKHNSLHDAKIIKACYERLNRE